MMPIVIQLQAPVRCFSDVDPIADRAAAPSRGFPNRPSHPPFLLTAEDRWLRSVVSGDPHVNVLVQCADMSMASGFDEMTELCAGTPYICELPGRLCLPDTPPGHLLLGDISTLTLRQQIELYDWLDRFGSTIQVVSLTSVPLWPLVEQGRFFEGLFYRLNVVSLSAGPQKD